LNQASTRYREEELKEFGDVVSHVSWKTAEAGLTDWLAGLRHSDVTSFFLAAF